MPQDLKPGVFEALEGMFQCVEAIHDNGLTVNDLREGCEMAFESGEEWAIICLWMMNQAIQNHLDEKDSKPCRKTST